MESQSLAILVIDENHLRASIIEAGLRETGHDNVTVVHEITGIARTIAKTNPDVIVIDLENPNRDVLENMFQLSRAVKRPVARFVDRADRASIEAAVEADLAQLRVIFALYRRYDPTINPGLIYEEIAARLREELDYGLEARHMSLYCDMLAGEPHVHIPRVVPELSTRRLLTMDWLEGKPLLTFKAGSLEARNKLALKSQDIVAHAPHGSQKLRIGRRMGTLQLGPWNADAIGR